MNVKQKNVIIAKLSKCEDVRNVDVHFDNLRKLGDSLLKNMEFVSHKIE